MSPFPPEYHVRVAKRQAAAFTLTELLVVLLLVAVLACIRLPALARVKDQTRIAQCSGNLRQFTLVSHIYGNDNGDRLPSTGGGNWPWDVPVTVVNVLLRDGATRNTMYCPGTPEQNVDGLWNFGGAFRVIGYELTFTAAPGVIASNINSTLTVPRISIGPGSSALALASQRVLIADATISQPGQSVAASRNLYTYTGVMGGYSAPGWQGHRASHLAGKLPAGGNMGMLDGHVEWRPFSVMIPRAIGLSLNPVFWW
jgi:prepilin-type N-terminal cleavage/methylation domain-containing protein/prepilin-type processing-associated H-X9-DG protein